MIFNINTDAVVAFTNTLEKMHRSALPVAIRGSLNSAAFDVKLKTMPISVKKEFVERNKTFFKANSRVVMARGFNVKSMKSLVGFIEMRLKGGNNFAVKDLLQQEFGGTIKGRSFIPTDEARGGSNSKAVRPSNRLSNVKKIVNASNVSGKTPQQRYMKAAMIAGKGGYVLSNLPNKELLQIKSIRKVSGATRIKTKAIYSYKYGRSVSVKPTHFMANASIISGRKIETFFIKEAKRQFERLRK